MSKRRKVRRFSPAQLAARAAALPVVTFPDLPVSAHREEIAEAIRDHQVVIISGETGSGKTTQIPKICLQLGRGIAGMIGHTQPRRLAARSVADRIASELGGSASRDAGQVVGYQVRFTDEVGPTTLVKLMTDGILLNEIQVDPDLNRYDTLIIDEAHERSLNIDFIMGYLARLLPRRPDLKVIITSATIDSDRFAKHFAQHSAQPVPVIEVSGRTYPVEIRYRPLAEEESVSPPDPPAFQQTVLEDPGDELAVLGYGLGEPLDLEQALSAAVDELLDEQPGDILVFLPGERDIREAQKHLEEFLAERRPPVAVEVIPLYARLSSAEQQRIFQPHSKRRIILSTNIAETSLTVPGIRYVIDTGLARVSRFSNKTKVQRLPIERVSQASTNQRAGRAGRLEEGIAIRLYSAGDYAERSHYTEPEILRTSLASVILQMAALGLGEVSEFPFIDPPSSRAVKDGVQLLVELGALKLDGTLTPLGAKLARLPIDPRLGRMLLAGDERGCASEVLVIIAALSIQDVRERPLDHQGAADQAHARFNDPRSDFVTYLNLWRYLNVQARDLSGSAFRRMCRSEYLHYLRFREWRDVVGQLRQMCREIGIPIDRLGDPSRAEVRKFASPAAAAVEYGRSNRAVDYDQLHRALLVGLLSNIGTWDQPKNNYLGARGTRFVIWPGSGLAGTHPSWIMAAELVETSRLFARTAAQIKVEWVEEAATHLVTRNYSEPYWSRAKGAAMIKEKTSLYGLVLAADRSILLSRLGDRTLGTESPTAATAKPGSIAAIARGILAGGDGAGWSSQFLQQQGGEVSARELSREMFISNALVENKWRAGYLPFVQQNQKTLEEAREVEHRSRRSGQVASAEKLYSFFDTRIPRRINSTHTFENWWKKERRKNPELLTLTWADVMQDETPPSDDGFPDEWHQGSITLKLEYDFQPGSATDGITATVPIEVLPQLVDEGFDWLVPGMLAELCSGTIRALPKEKRRLLAPAPEVGGLIASNLQYRSETLLDPEPQEDPRSLDASLDRLAAWGKQAGTIKKGERTSQPQAKVEQPAVVSRDFFPAFAREVARLRGIDLTAEDGEHARKQLPPHLRMHFRVVDNKGKTLGAGSTLETLQQKFSQQADRALHEVVRGAIKKQRGPSPWKQTGLTSFPKEGLPAIVEHVTDQGLTVRGYPSISAGKALGTVNLQLASSPDQASLETREGLAQLLYRELKLPTARITSRWSGREALLLAASPYPSTGALVEAASLAAARALVARKSSGTIRTVEEFRDLTQRCRDDFEEEIYRTLRVVVRSLEASQKVQEAFDNYPGASLQEVRRDVQQRQQKLLNKDFLAHMPATFLPHLPRYLQALAARLERASRTPTDVTRDRKRAAEVRQLEEDWQRVADAEAARPTEILVHDRLEHLKWLLEEVHVSQFAEHLGTSERISPTRLRRRLGSLREGDT